MNGFDKIGEGVWEDEKHEVEQEEYKTVEKILDRFPEAKSLYVVFYDKDDTTCDVFKTKVEAWCWNVKDEKMYQQLALGFVATTSPDEWTLGTHNRLQLKENGREKMMKYLAEHLPLAPLTPGYVVILKDEEDQKWIILGFSTALREMQDLFEEKRKNEMFFRRGNFRVARYADYNHYGLYAVKQSYPIGAKVPINSAGFDVIEQV